MNWKLKTILLYGIFLVISGNSIATENITLSAMNIPRLIESSDKGKFIDMTLAIEKHIDAKFNIGVFPASRARTAFASGEFDCFFPALESSLSNIPYVKSDNFYYKKMFLFYKKDKQQMNSLDKLTGKTIGITRGYTYPQEILENKAIKFDEANSDQLNVNKLLEDRIDAFLVEEKSGLKAINAAKATDEITYDKTIIISAEPVFYACSKTDKGKHAVESISKGLKAIVESGEYKSILGLPSPESLLK